MVVVYAFIALGVVFAIAALVVGREAHRLDAVPPRPVFDLDSAVEWVGDHLPFEVSAVLSHAEVRRIIEWQLEFLRQKGVSGNGSAPQVQPTVVVGAAETVEYILARARADGFECTPTQVHAVVEAQLDYLAAIGAVGPPAGPDELPET